MKDKITKVILILSVIFFLGVLWLVFYPYNVVEIKRLPYPVLTPNVKAGQNVTLDADYCKHLPLSAHFSVQFIELESLRVYQTAERYSSDLSIGCQRVEFNVLTPEDIPAGTYTLKLLLEYEVNPLRKIKYTFPSESFTVVESKSISERLDDIIDRLDYWEYAGEINE